MNTTTTETITSVPLKSIVYNRYQPRTLMDPTELENLAESIRENGMMQKPTARLLEDGCYELAFGHRRFEAYKLLTAQDKTSYGNMPLIVRELDNQQMFDLAWGENNEREDLNPIDEGNAYATYMREFEKTSKEAGEYFKTSEENIRAKVRLEKLPDMVKEKVRAGELNETAARALLTLTRVLPNDQHALKEALHDIKDGDKAEDAVESALRSSPNTKIIGNESGAHFSMKAKTFKYLPELTRQDAMKGLDWENNEWTKRAFAGYGVDIEEALQFLNMRLSVNNYGEAELIKSLIDKLNHLIKPPACTACPFFAQMDGIGFCALPTCFERKKEATDLADLHQTSEKTGIAIYADKDGKSTELTGWDDKHRKYWEKKGPDLRLKQDNRNRYHAGIYSGIPDDIAIVVVGKTYENWKKAEEQSRQDKGEQRERVDFELQRRINDIVEAQTETFVWEVVTPLFARLLDGVAQVDFLESLSENLDYYPSDVVPDRDQHRRKNMKKAERLNQVRRLIIFDVFYRNDLNNNRSDTKTPTAVLAKHCQGLATTWGVKLPKDFIDQAKTYDEAISLAITELDKSKAEK